MLRATIRSLIAHKVRLILTAISVIVGVSFVAGTFVLTDTVKGTFGDLFGEINAGIDLHVRSTTAFGDANGGEPLSGEVRDVVAAVPGVVSAEGIIIGFPAQVLDKNGDAISNGGAPALGWSTYDDPLLSPFSYETGQAPVGDAEVAVDAATADDAGFVIGDPVKIVTPGGPFVYTITALVGFGEVDSLAGATVAVFDKPVAQRLFDREGRYDAVEVRVDDTANVLAVQAAVQQRLDAVGAEPGAFEAVTGEQNAQDQQDGLNEAVDAINRFLLMFGYVALFVSTYNIINTFSIIVTQRTRELALLRALGASGRQVVWSVLLEALIVGTLASLGGLALGFGIAALIKSVLASGGLEAPPGALILQPRTVIVALASGIVTTVLAAVAPSIRAARVAPIAAIRDAQPPTTGGSVRRTAVGVGLFVVGLVMLIGVMTDHGPSNEIVGAGGGAGALFIGVSLVATLLARPAARAIGAGIARFRGVPGRLARENSMRTPRRTSSTASALMIGLTLVTLVLVLAASVTTTVSRVVDESFGSDLTISNEQFVPFSPSLYDTLSELPEVGQVGRFRFGQARVGGPDGDDTGIDGIDTSAIDTLYRMGIDDFDAAAFEAGGLLVSEREATERALRVGDRVTLTFPATGTRELPVIAIYTARNFSSTYVISSPTFEANFPSSASLADSLLMLRAAPGIGVDRLRAAVAPIVERDYPNVTVKNQAELKAERKEQIQQFLFIFFAMLAFSILIASIGVTNTLALSVFERTRELGLLRAIGMARRQIRSMVRWEAVIIAIFGGLLGLVLGVFLGFVMAGIFDSLGFALDVVVPVSLVWVIVVAFVLGLLAAAFPARRAARLDILHAIAAE
jgi:putative ABC transport system permease protein